jgi:hypothetical protein
MSDGWYYAEGDKTVGPLHLAELKKLLSLVSNQQQRIIKLLEEIDRNTS